jgi:hypothetical protein
MEVQWKNRTDGYIKINVPTPLSISFLTLLSNQIMSHVQFEMFCSEVLPYPYSEISK